MVPADSVRIPRVPTYSGCCLMKFNYVYGIITLYDLIFQFVPLLWICIYWQSFYPICAETQMVWASPRSLATTGGITFVFFSCRYLDVSVPCVCLHYWMICLQHIGLPHSEISGFTVICTYPKLFAAYHVLLRLWEPRHPPYALSFLLDSIVLLFVSIFTFFLEYIFCFSQYVKELRPRGLCGE